MKEFLITVIMLVFFVSNGVAAEITINEMTKNIEKALEQINDISFSTLLRTRPKDVSINDARVLSEGNIWFKKPGLGRQEFSLNFAPEKKNIRIYKVKGDSFDSYEILEQEGKINEQKYPLEFWKNSDVHPEKFFSMMKAWIQAGVPYSIVYQKDLDTYNVRFYENNISFLVRGDSWLPYGMITEQDNNITEDIWENIVVNAGVSDQLFEVTQNKDTQVNKSIYASKITGIELSRCGSIENVTEKEYFDGDKLLNPNNMIETDQIRGRKGEIFGCVFIVRGEPSGAVAQGLIDIKVAHPEMKNPATGKIETKSNLLSTNITIDKTDTATVIFWSDDEYKIVPGKWTFQFFGQGIKMAEKTFTVL